MRAAVLLALLAAVPARALPGPRLAPARGGARAPAAVPALAAVPGASSSGGKAFLLVGTQEANREFQLTHAHMAVEEAARAEGYEGLELYVLAPASERESVSRLVPHARFIEAEVDIRDHARIGAVVEQVDAFFRERGVTVMGVDGYRNGAAVLKANLVDRFGVAGNTARAVVTAHTKSLARQAVNQALPKHATISGVVDTEQQAVNLYRRIEEVEGAGAAVVMKPITGGGSHGVRKDIAGEARVREAFHELTAELEEFARRPGAGASNIDRGTPLMIEAQIHGVEVDVELVRQAGRTAAAIVSDNPPMGSNGTELGTTYPSQLPLSVQDAAIEAAGKFADAVGLGEGNLHIEVFVTPRGVQARRVSAEGLVDGRFAAIEAGPAGASVRDMTAEEVSVKLIEINARLGGAFVFEAIRLATGYDLIRSGVRSALGLPVETPPTGVNLARAASGFVEAKFLISGTTGVIERIKGLEKAARMAGVRFVRMLKKEGEPVMSMFDDTFDYVGYFLVEAATPEAVYRLTMEALDKVRLYIRAPDGRLTIQKGTFAHSWYDPAAHLEDLAAAKSSRN